MVACKIKPNGQLYLYPENGQLYLYPENSSLHTDIDLTILQIPGEIKEQLLQNNLVITVVYFVFGSVLNGKM